MSPDPGEPGHEERGWTHAICDECFNERQPARGWAERPIRVRDGSQNLLSDACCYCGKPTEGIYVRQNALEVHGVKA